MDMPIMKNQSPWPLIWLAAITLSGMAFAASAQTVDESAQTPPLLQDFSRKTVTQVEFKYSPDINNHPALAQLLAERTQEVVVEWIDENLPEDIPAFYEMHYELVAQTPHVVAVLGRGSAYTGGNHPNNMTESHIWLPEKQQWLTASMLISHPEGWQAVSDYAGEDLYQQYRSHFPNPSKQEQAWLDDHRNWINRGVGPDAENFKYFYPVASGDGRIAALKFIFPPYQVGPWADGSWTVDVPASILYPHVADEYRDLFVTP